MKIFETSIVANNPCYEEKRELNLSLFDVTGPVRVGVFANAKFDSLFLSFPTEENCSEKEVKKFIKDSEQTYFDTTVFFVPNSELVKPNNILDDVMLFINSVKQNDSNINISENPIFIATAKKNDGVIIAIATMNFNFEYGLIEKFKPINVEVHEMTISPETKFNQVTFVNSGEEASGEDFFSGYARENEDSFNFLKTIGLYDNKCLYWKDDEEFEDDED